MTHRIATTAAAIALVLSGCVGIPDGVTAVTGFDPERYLGTWYEIARLDHRFERGLSDVTATYSRRDDGGLAVVNRGYNTSAGEWEEAVGKAYFVAEPDVARLKVSFFGPFYGAYNVVRLGDAYDWSMVVGPDRSYLWILARQPTLDPATRDRLVRTAAELGFAVDELIWVAHDLGPDSDR
ncbi:MAG TPA: lipocalin family protein [Woeseiaceae bacterium]|nr:lipocalin family protein [Woeseiaceae bacterium]